MDGIAHLSLAEDESSGEGVQQHKPLSSRRIKKPHMLDVVIAKVEVEYFWTSRDNLSKQTSKKELGRTVYFWYLPVFHDQHRDEQPNIYRGDLSNVQRSFVLDDIVRTKFVSAKNEHLTTCESCKNKEATTTIGTECCSPPSSDAVKLAKKERLLKIAAREATQVANAEISVEQTQKAFHDEVKRAQQTLVRSGRNLDKVFAATELAPITSEALQDPATARSVYDSNLPVYSTLLGDKSWCDTVQFQTRDEFWEAFHSNYTNLRYSLSPVDRQKLDDDPWFFSHFNMPDAPETGWKRTEGDYYNVSGAFFVSVCKDKALSHRQRKGGVAYLWFRSSVDNLRFVTDNYERAQRYLKDTFGDILNYQRVWHSTLGLNFGRAMDIDGIAERAHKKTEKHIMQITEVSDAMKVVSDPSPTHKEKTTTIVVPSQHASTPSPAPSVASSPIHHSVHKNPSDPMIPATAAELLHEEAKREADMQMLAAQRQMERAIPVAARVAIVEPSITSIPQPEPQHLVTHTEHEAEIDFDEYNNTLERDLHEITAAFSDTDASSAEDLAHFQGFTHPSYQQPDQAYHPEPQPQSHKSVTLPPGFENVSRYAAEMAQSAISSITAPVAIPNTLVLQAHMQTYVQPRDVYQKSPVDTRARASSPTLPNPPTKRTFEEVITSEAQLKLKVARMEAQYNELVKENHSYRRTILVLDKKQYMFQEFASYMINSLGMARDTLTQVYEQARTCDVWDRNKLEESSKALVQKDMENARAARQARINGSSNTQQMQYDWENSNLPMPQEVQRQIATQYEQEYQHTNALHSTIQ